MTYAERALERGLATGHKTWIQEDGSIKIASDSEPGIARRVTFFAVGSFIQFRCTCPGAKHHDDELVPCRHSALAGRRLVREGIAVQTEGAIFCVPPEQLEILR